MDPAASYGPAGGNGGAEFRTCFRRRRPRNMPRATNKGTPTPIPAPMPAFTPVERPPVVDAAVASLLDVVVLAIEAEVDEACVDDELADVDMVGTTVETMVRTETEVVDVAVARDEDAADGASAMLNLPLVNKGAVAPLTNIWKKNDLETVRFLPRVCTSQSYVVTEPWNCPVIGDQLLYLDAE